MPNFGNTTTPSTGFFFDDFGHCNFESDIGAMPSPGGYITDMYLYVSGDGTTDPCWFMIWDGNGNIIFESGATSIPSGSRSVGGQAWRHTTMATPPYVSAGTHLLVGMWSEGNAVWTYESSGAVWFQRSVSSGGTRLNVTSTEGSGAFGAYVTYTAVNAPSISSLSTSNGVGGTNVSIFGSSFTHATQVTFGGANASSFSIVNDGQINAVVSGSSAYGPGSVVVFNPSGSASASFYVGGAPSITSFSPDYGTAGNTPTLAGSGFQYVSSATVAGVSASFSITNDSQMFVTTPGGTATGWQTTAVTNPAGTGTGSYFIGLGPNITGVSPGAGPRGTVVTLTGTGFTYVTSASVGGVGASFSVSSDTSMTVTVPSGASFGPSYINVTNPAGTSNNFTFSVGGIARGRRSGSWTVVPPQGRRSGSWVQGVTAQGRRSGAWVNTV